MLNSTKKRLFLFLLLASLASSPGRGFCMPIIKVNFYHVFGDNGLTLDEALENYEWARRRIKRELRVRLKISKVEVFNYSPFEIINGLSVADRGIEFLGAYRWIANRERGINGLSIVSTPPRLVDSIYWLVGAAAPRCDIDSGFAVISGENKNSFGEDRRYQSKIVMAHELAHALGAGHWPNTIMDADAGNLSKVKKLKFNKISRRQVAECLS